MSYYILLNGQSPYEVKLDSFCVMIKLISAWIAEISHTLCYMSFGIILNHSNNKNV